MKRSGEVPADLKAKPDGEADLDSRWWEHWDCDTCHLFDSVI